MSRGGMTFNIACISHDSLSSSIIGKATSGYLLSIASLWNSARKVLKSVLFYFKEIRRRRALSALLGSPKASSNSFKTSV